MLKVKCGGLARSELLLLLLLLLLFLLLTLLLWPVLLLLLLLYFVLLHSFSLVSKSICASFPSDLFCAATLSMCLTSAPPPLLRLTCANASFPQGRPVTQRPEYYPWPFHLFSFKNLEQQKNTFENHENTIKQPLKINLKNNYKNNQKTLKNH